MRMTGALLPGQIVRTRRFTLGVPGQFMITADGSAVLFLRSRAGDDPVSCLWALDLDSGTERLLADPDRLPGDRADLPGERADLAGGRAPGQPAGERPGPVRRQDTGIDPATGQSTVLAGQRDACWVHLVPGLPARTSSGILSGHADLAGTRRLTAGGRSRRLASSSGPCSA